MDGSSLWSCRRHRLEHGKLPQPSCTSEMTGMGRPKATAPCLVELMPAIVESKSPVDDGTAKVKLL
jgi:hypothetical protein